MYLYLQNTNSKHRRTFNVENLTRFKWLISDQPHEPQSTSKLWCAICRRHNKMGKKGVWVSQPSRSLRVDKIRAHENSEAHRQALAMEMQRTKSQAPITGALVVQETTHRKAMKSMLRK